MIDSSCYRPHQSVVLDTSFPHLLLPHHSPPPYEAPHDFLILALVTTIICAILNLISLAFRIPAIILSAMSINSKGNKDYPQANSYGKYSHVMTILNIFFTLCLALLITGLVVGCYSNRRSAYYYSSYYYSYYGC